MKSSTDTSFQTITVRADKYSFAIPAFGRWLTLEDMKTIASRCGSHFFDADSMRFFGSRIYDIKPVSDGWLFITSEKRPRSDDPRAYTLRKFAIADDSTGITIDTIGEFQQYGSLARARTALKHLRAADSK